MKMVFSKAYEPYKKEIVEIVQEFDNKGRVLNDQKRNSIKIFDLNGELINIKSFKVPNAINQIAYKFLRKSKAQRSFEYAHHLISQGIGTPAPIAYFEQVSGVTFQESFYVSRQLECDLTYRELVNQVDFPNRKNILRAFTRFTYDLHEKNIEFLDHSPGNTLIQINRGEYQFFLVDLNRMNFRELDFDARMKNFSRLTPRKEMVDVMAREYARLYGKSENEVFEKMWFYTVNFQEKFHRKKRIKKKFKFWKKK